MEERLEGLEGWDLFGALLVETDNVLEKLIERADKDPVLMQHCLKDSLKPIWEEAWSKMNVEPTLLESIANPTVNYRPLTSQPHLHPFYRLAGVKFYFQGRPGHREFLVRAAQAPYYCFYAQRALAEEYVSIVKKGQPTEAYALKYARSASQIHHAPGFILLAETYFDLATILWKKSRPQSVDYFREAFKNMIIAHYLQPYCVASMHNAYHGIGLKVSMGFDLNSTEEIVKELKLFLLREGIQFDFIRAEDDAIVCAKDIVSQHYRSPPEQESRSKKAKYFDIIDSESTLAFQNF